MGSKRQINTEDTALSEKGNIYKFTLETLTSS